MEHGTEHKLKPRTDERGGHYMKPMDLHEKAE